MKSFSRILFAFCVFFSLCLALEPRAQAYVDPGSGLLITQTAGAVVTAALFWFRRHIRNLFSRFGASARNSRQS